MDLNKIKEARTQYIGKTIMYFKEIESTHLYAKEIVNTNVENGTIILAETQTGAIGTKGRKWYTGNKNIAMTIIIKPECNISVLENFTIEIAEAMERAIYELYGYTLIIKEPNDLLLNGKKIAGILTQTATKAEIVQYIIISIGFNVNEEKFSKTIKDISTSLCREYNKKFSREEIISKFIEILENIIVSK